MARPEYEHNCRETNCYYFAKGTGVYRLPGWGPRGPVFVYFERRECEVGHRYSVEIYEEDVKREDSRRP